MDCHLKFDIQKIIEKIEPRLNVLKMVAGSKWGGHPSTLLNVLNSTTRSIIDYGSTVYSSAPKIWLNKLSASYNRGLRICLRSLRTTPVNALQTAAGSMPLHIRRIWLTKKEIVKSISVKLPVVRYINKEVTGTFNAKRHTFMESVAYEYMDIIEDIEHPDVKTLQFDH